MIYILNGCGETVDFFRMPGKYCCVCGNNHSKDPNVSFHRFPSDRTKRGRWLEVFDMHESDVKSHMRVCSRHFPDGDVSKPPNILGKRLTSPIKKRDPRAKKARKREENRHKGLHSTVSPQPFKISPSFKVGRLFQFYAMPLT